MAQHEPEYYSFRPQQPEDADTRSSDISSLSSETAGTRDSTGNSRQEAASTRDSTGISRQEAASTSQTMSGQARPVMLRLRSLSADYGQGWGRALLCGACPAPAPAPTFYTEAKPGSGTLRRLCDTLKRPFRRCASVRRSGRRLVQQEQREAVLFTATAIRDHVPHPYCSRGLPFRRGDTLLVTSVSDTGVWTGLCPASGRSGTFKFVDVQRDDLKIRQDKSQSYPELQNICQRSKSVSDLLSSINQETLIPKFILNGFDTTESLKLMNDEDLEYLGVTDEKTKDLILGTIDWLHLCSDSGQTSSGECSRVTDSGYNSSSESIRSNQNADSSSFLHSSKSVSQLTQSVNNLLISTPL